MSGIPAWARVGAKVACIKRGRWNFDGYGPAFNETVTIRSSYFDPLEGAVYLRFVEYRSPVYETRVGDIELGYLLTRFRPVTEPKSEAHDLAMFRDLLRQPVDA